MKKQKNAAKQAALEEQKVKIQQFEKGIKDLNRIIVKLTTDDVHEYEEKLIKTIFENIDALEGEFKKFKVLLKL